MLHEEISLLVQIEKFIKVYIAEHKNLEDFQLVVNLLYLREHEFIFVFCNLMNFLFCLSPSTLAASVYFDFAFLLIHYIIYGSLSGYYLLYLS